MNVFVCIDKNLGLSFNNRRLSSDKNIVIDMFKVSKNEPISITNYSQNLFKETGGNYQTYNNLEEIIAKNCKWMFLEHDLIENFEDFEDSINTLVIYNFNRFYPSDLKLKIDLSKFNLISSNDFEGNSHELITKTIYVKK